MIKYKFNVKVGEQTFEFAAEAKSQEDVFRQASFFSSLPDKCAPCGSLNLGLSYRQVKGNEYFSVICKNCHMELKIGQLKAGGLFLKDWAAQFQPDRQDRPDRQEAPKKSSKADDFSW